MASITLGMALGLYSPSQGQMGGMGGGIGGGMGGGMPTIPGTEFGGTTDPSSIRVVEGFHVIPSVGVSERYDSNVYFASESQLQGLTPEDFVTTVMPQVRGLYTDHKNLVRVNAVAGAVGSYYANNTALSYVGANGGAALDMSNLLSQWRPGARWTVSDTFFYSPQPPAFLTGGPLGEQANPLVAGFQAARTQTTSNSVNTVFEIPLKRTVSFGGSYTYSFIHYGASDVPQAPTLISQNTQAYTASLITQVSLYDSVRADFIGNEYDQGELGSSTTMGPAIGWTHRFSRTVSFNATGGVQVLSGEFGGVRFSPVLAPLGSLAILWNTPTTSLTLAYRSGITPSFQFQAAPMLNHTVSFSMTQQTPISNLAGLFGANYSVANEYGSNSGGALSWTTVGGTAGLLYRITQKTFLMLTYSYQNVDNVFGGTRSEFDRNVGQIALIQSLY